MANDDDWDDDDSSNDSNNGDGKPTAPKGLRAHAKALEEKAKQLEAKLAEFESAARKSRVEKALTAKGFDPAVAEIVPDAVAADDAALDKWLADKEKLFAKKAEEQTVDTGFEEDVLEEDRDGYMRISRASNAALPASKHADVRAAIAAAKTREEMAEILKKQGNSFVS